MWVPEGLWEMQGPYADSAQWLKISVSPYLSGTYQMMVEINLLQQFYSHGSLEKCDVTTNIKTSAPSPEHIRE